MAEGWTAAYTQSAIDFILSKVESERVASRLFEHRALLEANPDFGQCYDPVYPAARPPFSCRFIHVSDTPFTLYYLKDDDAQNIVIFCIEYQRAEPNARFSSIDWEVVDW